MSVPPRRRPHRWKVLAAVLAVAGLCGTTPPQASASARLDPDRATATVVALVNRHRAMAGCPELRPHPALERAAQRHSAYMARTRTLTHSGPGERRRPTTRAAALGYRGGLVAENIARGHRTARAVVARWMASPGHRRNILDCSYRETGIGVVAGRGGPWWTEVLGTRRRAAASHPGRSGW
ncbi:CAP domain-containing protein [Streptomyces albus subsp. chlorinus]|uniref:CAP domain-containing protein n=1 Tax=Streptomyces albus TaxID=1888 RepID=UPI00156ED967|nr:CAP domain-containing protein [Streptomyces albus]NSC21659.1 CAP domain-containing protein [Streptomyces albus subsp. chlorinus]